MTPPLLLAGDVGGTKTALALFPFATDPADSGAPLRRSVFASRDHPGLAPLLAEFLAPGEAAAVAGAVIGIAGPVSGNRCRATNLPWEVDGDRLAGELGLGCGIELVNDLVAMAEGLPLLGEEQRVCLHPGAPPIDGEAGTRLLLAVGTGLGMAQIVPSATPGRPPRILPSEGGHADFAPRTDEEVGLHRFLTRRFGGHVSAERVVSGPGIAHIYEYLRQSRPGEAAPEVARRIASAADPTPAIVAAALVDQPARRCPLAVAALELFVGALGAVAGSVALITLATGGIHLAGGVVERLRPALSGGRLLEALWDKGRFAGLLRAIPVWAVTEPETALLGAAARAARHAAATAAE